MAKLSKALRTDLNEMAALLRSKGRGRDTILAHINPEEAALLKMRGGSGKPNPNTGLPEFQGEGGDMGYEPFQQIDYSMFDEGPSAQQYAAGTAQPSMTPEELSAAVGPEMSQYYYPGETGLTFDDYPSSAQYAAGTAIPSTSYGAMTVQDQAAVSPFISGETTTTPTAPGLTTPPAQVDKDTLQKIEDTMKKYPKSTSALESLLGVGAKVGLGYLGAKPMQRTQTKAAQEAEKMGEQFAAMGKPIQAMGYQQLAQAEAGQLTPAQQRQIDATRAQQRQALSRAGITSGTAALQTEANLQRMANEFTQNNINTALNMIQFGDKYVAQGIKAGYDANLAANQSANIFYQNLFGLLGGTGNVLRG